MRLAGGGAGRRDDARELRQRRRQVRGPELVPRGLLLRRGAALEKRRERRVVRRAKSRDGGDDVAGPARPRKDRLVVLLLLDGLFVAAAHERAHDADEGRSGGSLGNTRFRRQNLRVFPRRV